MRNKVLIPLDRSDYSLQIVAAVKKFVSASDTEIVLFRVADPPIGVGVPTAMPAVRSIYPDYAVDDVTEAIPHPIYASQVEESISSAVEDELLMVVNELEQAGFQVSVETAFGKPAEEILKTIEEKKIDLVAMTTHAREGLSRLLFGSVAEKVLHHVSIPILLLHPTAPVGGS
jgi:nucleotide-binding universal stress UspA family protein